MDGQLHTHMHRQPEKECLQQLSVAKAYRLYAKAYLQSGTV